LTIMQGLLPGEIVLEQELASRFKEMGVVQVTNARLLWRRIGEPLFQLNTSRINVGQVSKAAGKEANVFVLKIEVQGMAKPVYLNFTGNDAE